MESRTPRQEIQTVTRWRPLSRDREGDADAWQALASP
jgi:hypothetical protein